MKENVRVKIKNADRMTDEQRRDVAGWLNEQADMLINEGKDYCPVYTGRYYGEEKRQ